MTSTEELEELRALLFLTVHRTIEVSASADEAFDLLVGFLYVPGSCLRGVGWAWAGRAWPRCAPVLWPAHGKRRPQHHLHP